MTDDLRSKASERYNQARGKAEEALATGRAKAGEARAKASEALTASREKARETAAATRERARAAAQKTGESLESNPLAAVAGGIAIGAIIAAMLPRTARENKLLGPVSRSVRATAKTTYHPVGTCRMGVDDGAVVEASFKVNGLDGIRVGAASVRRTRIGGTPTRQ